jgi:glutathione peroxidase
MITLPLWVKVIIYIACDLLARDNKEPKMTTFHNFHANYLNGDKCNFSDFKGKVVLMVNTASKCGLTPQYKQLETIYLKYQDKGLVVLGFPCNQFAHQEPGDSLTIATQCLVNYGVTFPVFEKCDVNGPNAHPVFVWVKEQLPGLLGGKIKWNFTKFLIDRNGQPVKRFAPLTKPLSIEPEIEKLLETIDV